jgi:hypothetical protein
MELPVVWANYISVALFLILGIGVWTSPQVGCRTRGVFGTDLARSALVGHCPHRLSDFAL